MKREGGREGGEEKGREGGEERGREGGREVKRKGGREVKREGGREGGEERGMEGGEEGKEKEKVSVGGRERSRGRRYEPPHSSLSTPVITRKTEHEERGTVR